jgi:murein DD-endopeptidase MepM/ murein hydrolase activator NlpD
MRAGTIFRGALLLAIVVILAWLVAAARVRAPPAAPQAAPLASTARSSPEPAGQLLVPVAGVRREALTDTFAQARGLGRPHDAIDIMAPRGTPVVAAADGIVEKLFFSNGGGGITAYVRSPDRQWIYYYAHLDAYAPGLREGARIRRGDPIGTVGSTGNANPAGPHLHFAIHFMAPDERWWQGRPVNPYPLLAARGPRR